MFYTPFKKDFVNDLRQTLYLAPHPVSKGGGLYGLGITYYQVQLFAVQFYF